MDDSRAFVHDGSVIYEYTPTFRSLTLRGGNRYFLYFPYCISVNRKHVRKSGAVTRTLHVGFRNTPLNEANLMDNELLFPPIGNVYAKNLLVCSPVSIHGFWSSPFDSRGSWPGDSVRAKTFGKYKKWEDMEIDDVLHTFDKWPDSIKYSYSDNGLSGGKNKSLPTRMSLGEMFGKISRHNLDHIDSVDRTSKFDMK